MDLKTRIATWVLVHAVQVSRSESQVRWPYIFLDVVRDMIKEPAYSSVIRKVAMFELQELSSTRGCPGYVNSEINLEDVAW